MNTTTSESESSPDFPILVVGRQLQASKGLTVRLTLDEVQVPMEVDTGAAVSLIAEETQQWLLPSLVREEPTVRLTTYTAEEIPVVGVIRVQVEY